MVLPVGLVRRLPRALTGVDPETLTFLSEDRYDTSSADALAAAAGLSHPPVKDALRHWADRLIADHFGSTPTAHTTPKRQGGHTPSAMAQTRPAPPSEAPDKTSPDTSGT
jgi:hypothetical protein